ncbi:sensor histidine kinase [candidate division KSB1 bacterium]|nr:sensor histidine kinase [candidate division KSB1 bacterium]NIR68804.1 sensor histidine kinase [candidate division KSB1 bacterium]NIS28136.1 sensor histidine kinase [candidate division KSB1 bacterium]NIT75032.1 sensor histidine kinase [candidate division KSB1 bacterium]NIU28816.1 sensor histidine kinase [candidate division KSB1 bacterium]
MKINLYRLKGRFKGLLFIFAILIIISLLFYSQRLVSALRAESREILLFYAQMYASAATAETSSNLNFIFEQIIQRTNFPIIMTDSDDTPIAWKGIDVDPNDHSKQAIAEVKEIMEVMKREADPIPIKYEGRLLNNLYYGDSKLIEQLQLLPYIEIAVVGLFILIGFFGFRSIKRSEEQFIWVGMSKETAHQIGTPLSSIMGWMELLKSKVQDRDAQKTLIEMERDVDRLNKITARFSQIGSRSELRRTKIHAVISEVVNYFQRRLPQWGKKVKITENYALQDSEVPLNKELFEWVIENLVKNSLDSIEKDSGQINIDVGSLKNGKHHIYIDISDNGRGIEGSKKSDIFKPGYSTKKRGWGLGLSLAKRIVEDYHGGKLVVKDTKIGEGTTMRVML